MVVLILGFLFDFINILLSIQICPQFLLGCWLSFSCSERLRYLNNVRVEERLEEYKKYQILGKCGNGQKRERRRRGMNIG